VKRGEIGAFVIGFLLVAGLVCVIAIWAGVLANNAYSNGASNFLGIIGTVPLVAAIAVAAWARWHRTCAVPYCLRLGEHPVSGTLEKVCHRHHTKEAHERVYDLRHAEHAASGRLEYGESHAKGKAPSQ
jgi:hypothetical protein